MVILSDMPANNPLTTHVRNQSITNSQEQCQKMMGLSKNKQTSTKEGTREILKVQKMFPLILYVKKHFDEEIKSFCNNLSNRNIVSSFTQQQRVPL